MNRERFRNSILAMTALLWAAGASAGGAQGVNEGALVRAELQALEAATLHLQRLDNAIADGWSQDISGCVELPGVGGMGHHWANISLMDGEVSLLRPEILVYEPMPDGSQRLVAVEYFVPAGLWGEADPPKLFGRHMHLQPVLDAWIMHVWLYRNNPAGMFEDWNPNVDCSHAQ